MSKQKAARKGKTYTPEEKDFIRENWKEKTDEELARALGRTLGGVQYHRRQLGLKRRERTGGWPKTEWSKEKIIRKLKELADELGRSPVSADDPNLASATKNYFGSWNIAKKKAGLRTFPRGFPRVHDRTKYSSGESEKMEMVKLSIRISNLTDSDEIEPLARKLAQLEGVNVGEKPRDMRPSSLVDWGKSEARSILKQYPQYYIHVQDGWAEETYNKIKGEEEGENESEQKCVDCGSDAEILVKLSAEGNPLSMCRSCAFDRTRENKLEVVSGDISTPEVTRKTADEEWRRRIKNGVRKGTEQLKWLNSSVPLGYRKREDKRLTVIEREAELVNRIFDLYIEMKSVHQVAWKLNKRGHRTKQGNEWTGRAIQKILDNEIYIGKFEYGDTEKYCKDLQIIDENKFRKAQEIKNTDKEGSLPKEMKKERTDEVFNEYFDFLESTVEVEERGAE